MYNRHIKETQISVSHPTLTYLTITKSQASKFKEYTRYYSKFLTFIDDIVRLVSVFESYVMNVNLSEDTNLKHLKFCKIWKHKRYRKYFQQNINFMPELLFPLIWIVNVNMHPLTTYRTYRKRLEVRKHLMNISRKYNIF